MDVTILAKTVVTFLSPFLPFLLKAAEKGAEEVGKKFGAEALDRATSLWDKLRGKSEVEKAAQDAAAMPDDPDAQAALRLQLKKLLTEDTAFADEIERFMGGEVVQRVLAEQGSQVRGVRQTAVGGGDVRQEVVARGESTVEDVQQKQG